MPFLAIGGTTYSVLEGADEKPEYIGEEVRTYAGTMRSTVSDEKFVGTFTLYDLSEANYQTLRTAIANLAFVTVTGDAIPGGSITASVRVEGAPYIRAGASFNRRPTLRITEQ